jgi:hypothetical protein
MRNLPYAFALGIQNEWNVKFKDALNSLIIRVIG